MAAGPGVLLACVVLVSLMLRAPITSVPPALTAISDTLGLTPSIAGLATALPLICFGVFAFLTPPLAARFGTFSTLTIGLALMIAGLVVRVMPSTVAFFAGVTLVGMGIAIGNVVIPAIVRTSFPLRLGLMMGIYSLGLQLGEPAER